MGTRSLTTIRSRWDAESKYDIHAHIYVHWDGYPSGHGKDIANYLDGLQVVNGIGLGDKPAKIANGPGRLAAQLVAHLQAIGSDPDLMPATIKECGQEYHYLIDVDYWTGGGTTVTVLDGPTTAFGLGGGKCKNKIFSGTVPEYLAWPADQK